MSFAFTVSMSAAAFQGDRDIARLINLLVSGAESGHRGWHTDADRREHWQLPRKRSRSHDRNRRYRHRHNDHIQPPQVTYRSDYARYLHHYYTANPDQDTFRRPGRHHSRWRNAGQLKTRSRHASQSVIPLNMNVRGIELQGVKRNANIIAAHAELLNGRTIRLPELEGFLANGGRRTAVLDRGRHVDKLILSIESVGRKRAYVRVNYRPGRRVPGAISAGPDRPSRAP